MQQGTRKAGKYLQICKAMAILTMDKYLVSLAAQAFVNGLNSHKVRQELENILPIGLYDFQDIHLAFGELRSRCLAKKSSVISLPVFTASAAISISVVLEATPTTTFQSTSDSVKTIPEVLELPTSPINLDLQQQTKKNQTRDKRLEGKQPIPTLDPLALVDSAQKDISEQNQSIKMD
jgi:hypothetical protein